MRRDAFWAILAVLLLASPAFAPAALCGESPVFQGKWTATLGTRTLRGGWSAQTLPGRPDAAHGSWTLESDTGSVLMQGTWSAEKSRRGWQGTWAARTSQSRTYAGTWSAYMADSRAKTFSDMLDAALEKEVAGLWRGSGREGNWWLKAASRKP